MINKRSVLVARSKLENEVLYSKLQSKFDVITIDLIHYKRLEIDIKELTLDYDYIVLTSKYACQIISDYSLNKKFLVVGIESGKILKKNINSENIIYFDSVEDIINYIKKLDKQKVIYLSGFTISKEIPNISRKIIYNIEHLNKLDNALLEQIKNKKFDYVMVFSKASFEKLIYILRIHDIISSIKSSLFVCISENVAEFVKQSFDLALCTEKPNQEDMIKLIYDYERK